MDVTTALKDMLGRITMDFPKSPKRQREVCFHLVSPVPWPLTRQDVGLATANWDTKEFIERSVNSPPQGFFTKANSEWEMCATGDCRNTVQVNGACHNMFSVNYVVYGHVTRLCSSVAMWVAANENVTVWGSLKNGLAPFVPTDSFGGEKDSVREQLRSDSVEEKYNWFLTGYYGLEYQRWTAPEPPYYSHCRKDCPHTCQRLNYRLPTMSTH
jgi:hypothetical protein